MITADLQKAIDNLQIQDVYLRNITAKCSEGFEPKYTDEIDTLDVQQMHLVKEASIVEVSDIGRLLCVNISLGIRWVGTNDQVKAIIEADFVAEYLIKSELDKNCIDEFALKNASYHVWPYWRELLANQTTRMHLPRLILPAWQLAHNRHQDTEVSEEN